MSSHWLAKCLKVFFFFHLSHTIRLQKIKSGFFLCVWVGGGGSIPPLIQPYNRKIKLNQSEILIKKDFNLWGPILILMCICQRNMLIVFIMILRKNLPEIDNVEKMGKITTINHATWISAEPMKQWANRHVILLL